MDLQDKVVLVVGGTSGIGLGVAQALAAEGCQVAVASRSQTKVEQAMARNLRIGCGAGSVTSRTERRSRICLPGWLGSSAIWPSWSTARASTLAGA
jgi:NAD(P)-dependent dehydrogenase (short-subunit alcohol dehydrogenase family)